MAKECPRCKEVHYEDYDYCADCASDIAEEQIYEMERRHEV